MAKFRRSVSRVDRVSPTPQGGLYVDAVISRVGILEYQQSDGSIRKEFRPPEEVLDPTSVASYANAPVTIDHPPANVTPDTWKSHSVGHVSEALSATSIMLAADKPPVEALSARLVIQDAAAMRNVQSGMLLELSPGYTVELDETPGYDPRFGKYDAVQRNIRANHIALLPPGSGRQGSSVSLRLDSNGDVVIYSSRMDEEAVKELVTGMLPDTEAMVTKVSEQVFAALPELVKGFVVEAMTGGAEAEAPEPAADGEGEMPEAPKEDQAPEETENPEASVEEEVETEDRVDAKVRARVETIRLYERAVRKDADLALDNLTLLRSAVEASGGTPRKDANETELRFWLEGRLAAPSLKEGRSDSKPIVDWDNPNSVVEYINSIQGDKE